MGALSALVRRQVTVSLPNRPGALAEICEAFRRLSVNIDAISVLDNVEQGVVRLLTSNPPAARSALEGRGFYVTEVEVLEIDAPNRAGVLADIAGALAAAGINIDYAYGTEGSNHPRMRICIKVSDPVRARDLLEALPLA